MAAKTGIIEEGMAVGSDNVAEALEGTAKTDLAVVAHYLYVCSLVETEDDAAAFLLDELLTAAASDGAELLRGSLQSELMSYLSDSESVQSGALCHFLIAKIGVFHLHKSACVTVAACRIVLAQTELTGMFGNRTK